MDCSMKMRKDENYTDENDISDEQSKIHVQHSEKGNVQSDGMEENGGKVNDQKVGQKIGRVGPEKDETNKDVFVKPKTEFVSPTFAAPKRTFNKQKKIVAKEEKVETMTAEVKEDELSTSTEKQVPQPNTTIEQPPPNSTRPIESKQKQQATTKQNTQVPYTTPSWCSKCAENYFFEILKNGVIKGTIDLTEKPSFLFGRLEGCDVILEHPSISRYHAVVVYRGRREGEEQQSNVKEGFYIMDLGSTHGTTVNKSTLKPNVYHRLRVGYCVKFGGSTRLHILQGPNEDQDQEIDMEEVQQMKREREERKSQIAEEDAANEDDDEEEGISWGMGEDAVEEEMDLEKLLASRTPLELKDPKKTLRGFFEREGIDLEYEADERGTGNSKVYVIRVRLPIEDASGDDLVAEGTSTKKKDAVVACAYEACRIIDAHGMLRNANHESERSKRAKRLAENDYYDSDEDSFLDRTGTVESKRKRRLKKARKEAEETVQTFDSLKELLDTALKEISSLEKTLEDDRKACSQDNEEVDDLDQYMSTITSRLDKKAKLDIKQRLAVLRKEQQRIERLIEIVKPATLPPMQTLSTEKFAAVNKPTTRKGKDEVSETTTKITENSESGLEKRSQSTPDLPKQRSPQVPQDKKMPEIKKPKVRTGTSLAEVVARMNPNRSEESNEGDHKGNETGNSKKKPKKKIYGAQRAPMIDTKFADWVPPTDQTGDGKTSLNEKFGY